jgi:hypothetical protein
MRVGMFFVLYLPGFRALLSIARARIYAVSHKSLALLPANL